LQVLSCTLILCRIALLGLLKWRLSGRYLFQQNCHAFRRLTTLHYKFNVTITKCKIKYKHTVISSSYFRAKRAVFNCSRYSYFVLTDEVSANLVAVDIILSYLGRARRKFTTSAEITDKIKRKNSKKSKNKLRKQK